MEVESLFIMQRCCVLDDHVLGAIGNNFIMRSALTYSRDRLIRLDYSSIIISLHGRYDLTRSTIQMLIFCVKFLENMMVSEFESLQRCNLIQSPIKTGTERDQIFVDLAWVLAVFRKCRLR